MQTVGWLILLLLLPVLFAAGFLLGRNSRHREKLKKRIEEYTFYPFITNNNGIVEFSQPLFNEAVRHFIKNKNEFASRQLIIIGEENRARDTLATDDLNNYLILYHRYEGQRLLQENDQFLENFKRIVILFGKSFKGTGIEILLHNLVNPGKSVIAIENGEVTGRKVENGTTNLLLDLKTRKQQNQDKLNYELRIGSRLFKCTTIPIFRRDYGLVGAICINVDVNFIREEIMHRQELLEAFIENIVRTDFTLNENILSKEEYQAAMAGKRHFADDVFHAGRKEDESRLMVILFSDIAGYSALMGHDEKQALAVLETNRNIHRESTNRYHGNILKEVGDGTLVSFNSVTDAVKCGIEMQKQVQDKGGYGLRIGMHLGEVFFSNNDIFGDGVNIASRIQALGEPGSVLVSEAVYQNIKNKIPEKIEFAGEHTLKNIEGVFRIYRLV